MNQMKQEEEARIIGELIAKVQKKYSDIPSSHALAIISVAMDDIQMARAMARGAYRELEVQRGENRRLLDTVLPAISMSDFKVSVKTAWRLLREINKTSLAKNEYIPAEKTLQKWLDAVHLEDAE